MNGETSIRPCRTGTSSGTRVLACSSSSPTGSRDSSGVNSACDSSGACALASFPRATRSARVSCSAAPAPAEPLPGTRPASRSRVLPVLFTAGPLSDEAHGQDQGHSLFSGPSGTADRIVPIGRIRDVTSSAWLSKWAAASGALTAVLVAIAFFAGPSSVLAQDHNHLTVASAQTLS